MNIENLKGIFPALMTAFTDDGSAIDRARIAALCNELIGAGVDGFYVGGSSGEMLLCSPDERKALLEAVIDTVKGSGKPLSVIAHVGAAGMVDTLELARHARSVGADALSSVTPLYFKYGFAEVKHFYARICEVGLPVIIYNIPALTGMSLGFEQLCELLSLDGVAGMKFTSSDFFQLNRLKTEFPEKVFYNGSDEMLLSGLSAGADGGIGTTYNFMPELFVAIRKAFLEGRIDDARKIQTAANRAIAEVIRAGVIPSSKNMIRFRGIEYGTAREPFLPISDEAERVLYECGYLPMKVFIDELKGGNI